MTSATTLAADYYHGKVPLMNGDIAEGTIKAVKEDQPEYISGIAES